MICYRLSAYQAYIDNFIALANWENRDKFWQKVIGYVQRQMTAYDAQIHCSGVKRVLDNENSLARQLELVTPARARAFAMVAYRGLWLPIPAIPLKSYVEQKQTHLLDLGSHLSKECITSSINCSLL